MATLQDPKVREFLSQGTRTGLVGYTSSDGRPLVAPVWFVVDDDVLVFNTGKASAKGRSILRDPRLTLCVDLPEPPFGFVQVQGTAEISEDPQDLLDTATRIAARYVGPDEAEEFGRRNGVPGEVVVRLRPTKINAAFDMIV
ncbi:PPOX class F420-dependent oxidoreductase [Saccharopolyspora rhizosphaerae]|uniref:PPOX class F420-dependent oxidoreductase n=1 Tax=Saccharopolyspora rhizosphaerae TaxID=2492662 RepID=A0A3R8P214_9PSEU|nr:PPOX class F420-dependent oxidoreductase [Saccharopolyspora rhizosphaerae]RRO14895.1 PPOX class F420-dependent oxidoreductase [Saccharopolyspora rhizosphaerae]